MVTLFRWRIEDGSRVGVKISAYYVLTVRCLMHVPNTAAALRYISTSVLDVVVRCFADSVRVRPIEGIY